MLQATRLFGCANKLMHRCPLSAARKVCQSGSSASRIIYNYQHVRSLFNFGVFSKPVQQTHHERRLINIPQETIYYVVANVADYKHFVPWCIDSRVLLQKDNYMEAELTVGFQLLSERYVSRVTLDPCKRVEAVAKGTQLFHFLRNEWCFAPGPTPDSSYVDFRVEFAFRSVLYTQAAGLFFDEVVSKMVAAYEKRCHAIENQQLQPPQVSCQLRRQALGRAAEQQIAAIQPQQQLQPKIVREIEPNPEFLRRYMPPHTQQRRPPPIISPLRPSIW